jgi:hypothetical protein
MQETYTVAEMLRLMREEEVCSSRALILSRLEEHMLEGPTEQEMPRMGSMIILRRGFA